MRRRLIISLKSTDLSVIVAGYGVAAISSTLLVKQRYLAAIVRPLQRRLRTLQLKSLNCNSGDEKGLLVSSIILCIGSIAHLSGVNDSSRCNNVSSLRIDLTARRRRTSLLRTLKRDGTRSIIAQSVPVTYALRLMSC